MKRSRMQWLNMSRCGALVPQSYTSYFLHFAILAALMQMSNDLSECCCHWYASPSTIVQGTQAAVTGNIGKWARISWGLAGGFEMLISATIEEIYLFETGLASRLHGTSEIHPLRSVLQL